jgi:hypothetical protein
VHNILSIGVVSHVRHGDALGQQLSCPREQNARVHIEREEAKQHDETRDPTQLGHGAAEQQHAYTDHVCTVERQIIVPCKGMKFAIRTNGHEESPPNNQRASFSGLRSRMNSLHTRNHDSRGLDPAGLGYWCFRVIATNLARLAFLGSNITLSHNINEVRY